jgi:hypothetical protein
MKLGSLLSNACAVVLLAKLWLCQTALAADAPPGKQGEAGFLVRLKPVQGTGVPILT